MPKTVGGGEALLNDRGEPGDNRSKNRKGRKRANKACQLSGNEFLFGNEKEPVFYTQFLSARDIENHRNSWVWGKH